MNRFFFQFTVPDPRKRGDAFPCLMVIEKAKDRHEATALFREAIGDVASITHIEQTNAIEPVIELEQLEPAKPVF